MKRVYSITIAALLMTTGNLSAGAFDEKVVSADAKFVAFLDLEVGRKTALGEWAMEKLRENEEFQQFEEIMLNAAGLAFIVAGSRWGQPDGQVMFIFILTMAAAEVSVGLALILQIYHHLKTVDGDAANKMKG